MMNDFTKKQIFKSEINTTHSHTTIRLKSNGFVLSTFDRNHNILLVDEVNELKADGNLIKTLHFIKEQYSLEANSDIPLKIIYHANHYALVPKMYFDENHLKSYFLHAICRKDTLDFDYIYSALAHDIICVNAIEKSSFEQLNSAFPKAQFFSDSEIIIKVCTEDFLQRIEDEKNYLYLHISNHDCDILEFVDGKINLMNRITFNTIENFNYYILNTLHQTGQFAEQTEVILLGDIQKQSAIVLGLSRYFQRIHFLTNHRNKEIESTSHNYAIETFLM